VFALFSEKISQGIETAKQDIELIRDRLKLVQKHSEGVRKLSNIERGSTNVYADLGLPDAEENACKGTVG